MAFAAPTQLATINSNTAAQTTWATASITFPAGSLGLMLIAISGATAVSGLTVSDSAGNTWAVRALEDNAAGTGCHTAVAEFYFASSTTTVVTATFVSLNMRQGWCGYTTGSLTTGEFDVSGVGGGTTAATSTSATTGARTADDDIGLVAFCTTNNATGPTTWPTAGYTSLFNPTDATRSRIAGFEYQITTGGSGTTLASGTISYTTASAPAASIATFKPSAAAAAFTRWRPVVLLQAVQRSSQR
jgi:hypothetical protein